MRMTWTSTPTRDEDAFAAIKAGIDALPPGVKMLLNSGEGAPHPETSVSGYLERNSRDVTLLFQPNSTDTA